MKTTLKQIRAAGPCGLHLTEDGERTGYLKLKHYLGKGYGDDAPISLATVLDSNGLDDAHWCFQAVEGHDREKRLYGVWCVRDRCADFLTDESSINALRVSELYANGQATDAELAAALAAGDASLAAGDASLAAVAAALAALAALDAGAAALDAGDAGAAALAAGAAALAAGDASLAAWDTARDDQAAELRRVCACIDAGEDPYPFNTETARERAAE